jgi:hypothetical protein
VSAPDRQRAADIARERVRTMRAAHIRLLSSANRYAWSVEISALGGNGEIPEKALAELRLAMAHLTEAAFIIGLD